RDDQGLAHEEPTVEMHRPDGGVRPGCTGLSLWCIDVVRRVRRLQLPEAEVGCGLHPDMTLWSSGRGRDVEPVAGRDIQRHLLRLGRWGRYAETDVGDWPDTEAGLGREHVQLRTRRPGSLGRRGLAAHWVARTGACPRDPAGTEHGEREDREQQPDVHWLL